MDEFELTYLAKEIPANLGKFPSKEMLDIYLPTDTNHPNLRIRKCGEKLEITKKQPVREDDASHQNEQTIVLNEKEYEELNVIKGRRVRKTRFDYEEGETRFEIDIFRDELAGLVLVEVEFDSQKSKESFSMPQFCLADVTQEKFIAGGMLSGKSYVDIQDDLDKFEYKKLLLS